MSKLILVLIIAAGVVYWRGNKILIQQKGWDCNWHTVYAMCMTENKKVLNADSPKFIDAMKAGIDFKNGFKF